MEFHLCQWSYVKDLFEKILDSLSPFRVLSYVSWKLKVRNIHVFGVTILKGLKIPQHEQI